MSTEGTDFSECMVNCDLYEYFGQINNPSKQQVSDIIADWFVNIEQQSKDKEGVFGYMSFLREPKKEYFQSQLFFGIEKTDTFTRGCVQVTFSRLDSDSISAYRPVEHLHEDEIRDLVTEFLTKGDLGIFTQFEKTSKDQLDEDFQLFVPYIIPKNSIIE